MRGWPTAAAVPGPAIGDAAKAALRQPVDGASHARRHGEGLGRQQERGEDRVTWNPYRIIRRWLRDPNYFQAVAYSFSFALAVVLLTVGPMALEAGR